MNSQNVKFLSETGKHEVFSGINRLPYLLVDVAQEVDFIGQSANLILQICFDQVGRVYILQTVTHKDKVSLKPANQNEFGSERLFRIKTLSEKNHLSAGIKHISN